jgi:hypothetical protein
MPVAGWYADPATPSRLRWWDGAMWTAHVHPPEQPRSNWKFPRSWLVLAGAIALVCLLCFGMAESMSTTNPDSWFLAGLIATGVLTLVGACLTLGRRRWREVALFALTVSVATSITLFGVSAPSTSRSCSTDRPSSTEATDCDTSYGLGMPFLIAAFFVPAYGLAALGKGATRLARRKAVA